jgi:hypothetical protein
MINRNFCRNSMPNKCWSCVSFAMFRFLTGSATSASDTRRTSARRRRKPICMLQRRRQVGDRPGVAKVRYLLTNTQPIFYFLQPFSTLSCLLLALAHLPTAFLPPRHLMFCSFVVDYFGSPDRLTSSNVSLTRHIRQSVQSNNDRT